MSAVLKPEEFGAMPLVAMLAMVPMVAADIPSVVEIERDIYEFPWTPGNFSDSLDAGYRCSVLWQGSRIAAYAVVMQGAGEAHLLNLSIARAAQGHGLGARVLSHLMAAALAAGAHDMMLEVRPSNSAGRALYAKAGFVQLGVRKDYYPARSANGGRGAGTWRPGREDALVLGCALRAAEAGS